MTTAHPAVPARSATESAARTPARWPTESAAQTPATPPPESAAQTPALPAHAGRLRRHGQSGRRTSERECSLRADEVEVLALLAEGLPLDTVARQLAVSERTLRRRTRAICDVLGVPAAITAVAWAARRGLL